MSTAKSYDEGLPGYRPSVGEHHDNCRSLWLEVMHRALDDLHGTRNWTPPDRVRRDALEWFVSESHAIGSFRWTCSVLELSPDAVRKAIPNRARRSAQLIDKDRFTSCRLAAL
jgi:hypothetical protein